MALILIGTSGWQFPAIKSFLNENFSKSNDLSGYSTLFKTVENNSAFYHKPRLSTLKKWYENTPDDFIFSIKLNRSFTHQYHLELNEERIQELKIFFENLQTLGPKFGAVLIQTPPSLKYNLSLLKSFLKTISSIISNLKYKPNIAIELRNEKWFSDEIYQLLYSYNFTLVMSDSKFYPLKKIITADSVYIRFHGPLELFRSTYAESLLVEWKTYLMGLKKIRKIYIYFNNTLSPKVIENANYMQHLLLAR